MQDITIDIATGASAKAKRWKNEKIKWSTLIKRLKKPVVTSETYDRFISMSKEDQGAVKDVGGFVGGYLVSGKRHPQNVKHRQLLTLDLDFADNFLWDMLTLAYPYEMVLHGTHKHSDDTPRYRLIIPLDREVTPTEYEAIARRIAGNIGIKQFDATTFQVSRLMFWPSVSSDSRYYFEHQEGEPVEADAVLSTYVDFTDASEWPTSKEEFSEVRDRAKKQQNPTDKAGLIGAFCRAYSIEEAIEKYLSDIYEPCADGRYTYSGGSTSAGLVIYDDVFAYSHHGTDPISGQLCNAYDLVRIHKFGHLDADGSHKSVKEMEMLMTSDSKVASQISEERIESAVYDFAEEPDYLEQMQSRSAEDEIEIATVVDEDWKSKLMIGGKGEILSNSQNINLVLKNDGNVNALFAYNEFDTKRYLVRSAPWRAISTPEPMRDVDYSGIRNYLDTVYGISNVGKVDDALALVFDRNSYHPIRNYLNALPSWDGICRVDTLLHDYLGAENTIYTREVMRKALCAAVARVFKPGTKYDMTLVLVGQGTGSKNQGTGKSTFIRKLARYKWFSDSFTTVQGKESFEQLQGAWLIEVAELAAYKKSEAEGVKQFMSKQFDKFRPAYSRTVEDFQRQCVFIATTNEDGFLRDSTGNRRFNPVDVYPHRAKKSVLFSEELDNEVDQIWAEALHYYRQGEPLYLSIEANKYAEREQSGHLEADDRRGLIEEYLHTKLPKNWENKDLYERKLYFADDEQEGTVERQYVCTAEIWCECLGMDRSSLNARSTRELNDVMRTIPGWEAKKSTRHFKGYGSQRCFERVKQ